MIDIDALSEEDLVELNHQVVARLKWLREMRDHQQMRQFRVGQKVAFQPPGHATLTGIIVKCNRKTVTVLTGQGQQWNVAPVFLARDITPDVSPAADAIVPRLPRST